MKKVILSAAAIFAFGFASAQQSEDIRFGVKGGLNFSNFTGDVESDGKTGVYVGGLADIPISGAFHIQPELLYSSEGADDAGLDFIRIPIIGKYYLLEAFSLQAGPVLGFKVGGDDGADSVTKALDFGLGFGAAYELPQGIFFDLRYNAGLANIYDGDGADIGTSNFQIGLGYRF
ncbi:MAG: PorT family protein [Flavobacterium sp.]|nr:PorT family protein [Flavobacterium sp.]